MGTTVLFQPGVTHTWTLGRGQQALPGRRRGPRERAGAGVGWGGGGTGAPPDPPPLPPGSKLRPKGVYRLLAATLAHSARPGLSCRGRQPAPRCVQRPRGAPHGVTGGGRRAGRPLYGDVRAAPRRVARETTFPALWFPGPPLPIHLFRQWGRFRTNPQHSRPQ